jgi:hypothetical protein
MPMGLGSQIGQGYLTIVDRPGLEARVCECYGVVQHEFIRLLGE